MGIIQHCEAVLTQVAEDIQTHMLCRNKMMNILISNVIGALCQDDYKGINNQCIDQGKVVLCLRNTNSEIGEKPTRQVRSGHMKEHMGG